MGIVWGCATSEEQLATDMQLVQLLRNPASSFRLTKIHLNETYLTLQYVPVGATMPNRLIKFCKREHNVALGAPTLRIGTLDDFRTLECPTLRDRREATSHLAFTQEFTFSMDNSLSEALSGGGITSDGSLQVTVKKGSTIKKKIDNCYAFCVANLDHYPTLEEAKGFDLAYNSAYEVLDPNEFSRITTDVLAQSLAISNIATRHHKILIKTPLSEMNIYVEGKHRSVIYIPSRRIEISSASDFPALIKIMNNGMQRIFIKRQKDSYQCEYRFAFILADKNFRQMKVKKDPVLIPSDSLQAICKHIELD